MMDLQALRRELMAILRDAETREELLGSLIVLLGHVVYGAQPRPWRALLGGQWREWRRRR
jgi:hypothetical protein